MQAAPISKGLPTKVPTGETVGAVAVSGLLVFLAGEATGLVLTNVAGITTTGIAVAVTRPPPIAVGMRVAAADSYLIFEHYADGVIARFITALTATSVTTGFSS